MPRSNKTDSPEINRMANLRKRRSVIKTTASENRLLLLVGPESRYQKYLDQEMERKAGGRICEG